MSEHEPLSPVGQQRRREMLGELQGELKRVKRARARREAIGGVVVALIACGAVGLTLNAIHTNSMSLPNQGPLLANQSSPSGPAGAPSPETPHVTIAVVETDSSIMHRLDAHPSMDGLQILTDRELLDDLHAAGHDCGLIKMQGRAWLTCDIATPGGRDPDGISGG